jgi:hypothetical protein
MFTASKATCFTSILKRSCTQSNRTSASRLQGYRKVSAPGGSEVPRNAMIIATDFQGRLHVYCRAALAEEWATVNACAASSSGAATTAQ